MKFENMINQKEIDMNDKIQYFYNWKHKQA